MMDGEIFERFKGLSAFVIGDVMLDKYLTGQVARISPEAPVPVVEWRGEENRLGGAANVALNILGLGASVCLAGIIGKDAESTSFLGLLPQYGLSDDGIYQSKERMTTVKTRVIAGSQHLLRLDREETNKLSVTEAEYLLDRVQALVRNHSFDVMILQDYDKGVLSKPVIDELLSLARRKNIPVAVDPKSRNFWEYREVDLFKPNLKEVKDALQCPITAEEKSLQWATSLLREKLSNKRTMITLSDNGVFIEEDGSGKIFPANKRTVADVCGAGDTVIAVAALALVLGLNLSEMALLANLAGGQVVEKVGVVPVDALQLEKEYLQHLATLAKI